jgi:hypothetical protein
VALEQFVALAAAQGHPYRAQVLATAAAAHREWLGTTQWPEMPAWAHRHLAAARHALTGCAAAAATAEGTTMTLPQAIHYALTTNPPG